ncbi:hypothetical protein CsSME_00044485 [Camellia sinensis var. sinensis]
MEGEDEANRKKTTKAPNQGTENTSSDGSSPPHSVREKTNDKEKVNLKFPEKIFQISLAGRKRFVFIHHCNSDSVFHL